MTCTCKDTNHSPFLHHFLSCCAFLLLFCLEILLNGVFQRVWWGLCHRLVGALFGNLEKVHRYSLPNADLTSVARSGFGAHPPAHDLQDVAIEASRCSHRGISPSHTSETLVLVDGLVSCCVCVCQFGRNRERERERERQDQDMTDALTTHRCTHDTPSLTPQTPQTLETHVAHLRLTWHILVVSPRILLFNDRIEPAHQFDF